MLSVSSMTWAAGLSFNNYQNNISSISRNAIDILSSCRGAAELFRE